MIKKFKNWYNNLLPFNKTRFWSVVIGIVLCIVLIFITILRFPNLNDSLFIIFFVCPFVSLSISFLIAIGTVQKESNYKLKKRYKEAEDTINVWFDSACSEYIKVNIKYNEDSVEILSYYNEKYLLVNSFYVERKKSTLDKKTIYYIYAECEGKQDKVVFPKEIKNAGYILARFTLAN